MPPPASGSIATAYGRREERGSRGSRVKQELLLSCSIVFPIGDTIVLIQAGYDIAFRCKAATPMLLQVHLRPELRARLKTPEAFRLEPAVPFRTYTDDFGNICTRLIAPAGVLKLSNRFVIRDKGAPESLPLKARQAKVQDLPDEVLVYLLGSRYCDTQKLSDLAWSRSDQNWI